MINPQPDDLIEDALRALPVAGVPADFRQRVMREVRRAPAPSAALAGFRLTWIDYALALFLTLLPAVGFGIWALLPRQAWLQLQFLWQVFQWNTLQPVIIVSLAAAGVVLLLAVLVSLGLLLRPRLVTR